jgi:hypothetical protein
MKKESHWDYIGRRLQEDRMIAGEIPITEIDIYKKNIADLQEQLQNSYIKQKLFLDKLNELQKRKTIDLAMEMKQLNFDFKLECDSFEELEDPQIELDF